VDRHQGGEQSEGEEERGSQVNHSLSPNLSTAAQRATWNFDPSRFGTPLKQLHVRDTFDCQAVWNETGTVSSEGALPAAGA
jgi:hypothetical protein